MKQHLATFMLFATGTIAFVMAISPDLPPRPEPLVVSEWMRAIAFVWCAFCLFGAFGPDDAP